MRSSAFPVIRKPSPAIWIISRTGLLLRPDCQSCANVALVTHYAHFHGPAIFGHDNLRNHSPVREIDELDILRRLVKTEMIRQVDIRQVGTHQLVFIVRALPTVLCSVLAFRRRWSVRRSVRLESFFQPSRSLIAPVCLAFIGGTAWALPWNSTRCPAESCTPSARESGQERTGSE